MSCLLCSSALNAPSLIRVEHNDPDWDNQIVTLFQENKKALESKIPKKGLVRFQARQATAFTCKEAENLVIKLFQRSIKINDPQPHLAMSPMTEYVESVQAGRGLIQQYQLDQIEIPDARAIPMGNAGTLVVMDRIPAELEPYRARELFEREFEQFGDDPDLELEWKEKFRQAAQYICLSGYWDVSHKNLLLNSDTRSLAFIDFEDVVPKEGQILNGLIGLLQMAPPCCFDEILKVADANGVDKLSLKMKMVLAGVSKEARAAELEFNGQLRKWREGNKKQPPFEKTDFTTLCEDSLVNSIVKILLNRVAIDTVLRSARREEPFAVPLNALSGHPSKNEIEAALNTLKQAGLILWKPADPKTLTYEIYCR